MTSILKIQMIYAFRVKKHDESESELRSPKLRLLTISLDAFVTMLIHVGIRKRKTPTNTKFTKMIVKFGFSMLFYPKIIYYVYFTFTSHYTQERPPQIQNS